ncbi:hypothetical protein AB4Y40_17685 [Paraburkholderia sp. EG287B]|uniref:hypothetical protein n=1 Tax=unclassified Paraburkholderia TaxID=2615204 RepID=UPI0034D3534A
MLSCTIPALLQTSELRSRAEQEVAIDPFFFLSAQRDGGAVTDFIFDYANPAALRFWKLAEADIPGSSFKQAALMSLWNIDGASIRAIHDTTHHKHAAFNALKVRFAVQPVSIRPEPTYVSPAFPSPFTRSRC